MKSADFVEVIVSEYGGLPKDWKRQSKKKDGEAIVRVFKNSLTGEVIQVTENVLGIHLVCLTGKDIEGNPITVNLLPVRMNKDLSGRVVFDKGELGLNEGRFFFDCGPETTDGALYDQIQDESPKLRQLFADMDPSIHDAENLHSVAVPGWSAERIWAVVEKRLIRSGAVKMED
jgi:hypothetical protein